MGQWPTVGVVLKGHVQAVDRLQHQAVHLGPLIPALVQHAPGLDLASLENQIGQQDLDLIGLRNLDQIIPQGLDQIGQRDLDQIGQRDLDQIGQRDLDQIILEGPNRQIQNVLALSGPRDLNPADQYAHVRDQGRIILKSRAQGIQVALNLRGRGLDQDLDLVHRLNAALSPNPTLMWKQNPKMTQSKTTIINDKLLTFLPLSSSSSN